MAAATFRIETCAARRETHQVKVSSDPLQQLSAADPDKLLEMTHQFTSAADATEQDLERDRHTRGVQHRPTTVARW